MRAARDRQWFWEKAVGRRAARGICWLVSAGARGLEKAEGRRISTGKCLLAPSWRTRAKQQRGLKKGRASEEAYP